MVYYMEQSVDRSYRILFSVPIPRKFPGRFSSFRHILKIENCWLLSLKTSKLILTNWGSEFQHEESSQCFWSDIAEYTKKHKHGRFMAQRLSLLGITPHNYLTKLYFIHYSNQVYCPLNFQHGYQPFRTALISVPADHGNETFPGEGDFRYTCWSY